MLAAIALFVFGCTVTAEQQRVLDAHAAEQQRAGHWTQQQADEFRQGRAVDWGFIAYLVGTAITGALGGAGLVRRARGPAKPLTALETERLRKILGGHS